jgi:tape measure domain-containing protein
MSGILIDVDVGGNSNKDIATINKNIRTIGTTATAVSKSLESSLGNTKLGAFGKRITDLIPSFKKLDTTANTTFKNISNSASDTTKAVDKTSGSIKGLAVALGSIAALSVVVAKANAFTNMQNKLMLITKSSAELNALQKDLITTSKESRSSLESTTALYSKFAISLSEASISSTDFLKATKTIQQAAAISGSSMESANAAITQLGQGLSSGVLRGEELNSIMEQLPRAAKLIAEGLGVGIGELRAMGAEGELTSEKVFKAILKGSKNINEEFGRTKITVSQALTALNDSLSVLVGTIDRLTGVSSIFSKVTLDLANSFLDLANYVDAAVTSIQSSFALYIQTMTKVSFWVNYINGLKVNLTNIFEAKGLLAEMRGVKEIVGWIDELSALNIIEPILTRAVELFNKLKVPMVEVIKLAYAIGYAFIKSFTTFKYMIPEIGAPVLTVFKRVEMATLNLGATVTAMTAHTLTNIGLFADGIKEFLNVYWFWDTRSERALYDIAGAKSIQDLTRKFYELGDALSTRNWATMSVVINDKISLVKGLTNWMHGLAASVGLVETKLLYVNNIRFDRLLRAIQTVTTAMSYLYSGYILPKTTEFVTKVYTNIMSILIPVTNALISIIEGLDGRAMARSFADSIIKIVNFAINGIKKFMGSIELPSFDAELLDVLGKLFSEIGAFLDESFSILLSADFSGIIDSIVDKIGSAVSKINLVPLVKILLARLEQAITFLSSKLADSLAKVTADNIMESFTYYFNKLKINLSAGGVFDDMIDSITAASKDLMANAIKFIAQFIKAVIDLFARAYDEVVGHSWWPDLINGVIAYAKGINKAYAPIQAFTSSVSTAFKGLHTAIMGSQNPMEVIIERFKQLFKELINTAGAFAQSFGLVIINAIIFGFLDGKARLFFIVEHMLSELWHLVKSDTKLFESILEDIGEMAGVYFEHAAQVATNAINAVIKMLPAILKGIVSQLDGVLGTLLQGIVSVIPNAVLAALLMLAYFLPKVVKGAFSKTIAPALIKPLQAGLANVSKLIPGNSILQTLIVGRHPALLVAAALVATKMVFTAVSAATLGTIGIPLIYLMFMGDKSTAKVTAKLTKDIIGKVLPAIFSPFTTALKAYWEVAWAAIKMPGTIFMGTMKGMFRPETLFQGPPTALNAAADNLNASFRKMFTNIRAGWADYKGNKISIWHLLFGKQGTRKEMAEFKANFSTFFSEMGKSISSRWASIRKSMGAGPGSMRNRIGGSSFGQTAQLAWVASLDAMSKATGAFVGFVSRSWVKLAELTGRLGNGISTAMSKINISSRVIIGLVAAIGLLGSSGAFAVGIAGIGTAAMSATSSIISLTLAILGMYASIKLIQILLKTRKKMTDEGFTFGKALHDSTKESLATMMEMFRVFRTGLGKLFKGIGDLLFKSIDLKKWFTGGLFAKAGDFGRGIGLALGDIGSSIRKFKPPKIKWASLMSGFTDFAVKLGEGGFKLGSRLAGAIGAGASGLASAFRFMITPVGAMITAVTVLTGLLIGVLGWGKAFTDMLYNMGKAVGQFFGFITKDKEEYLKDKFEDIAKAIPREKSLKLFDAQTLLQNVAYLAMTQDQLKELETQLKALDKAQRMFGKDLAQGGGRDYEKGFQRSNDAADKLIQTVSKLPKLTDTAGVDVEYAKLQEAFKQPLIQKERVGNAANLAKQTFEEALKGDFHILLVPEFDIQGDKALADFSKKVQDKISLASVDMGKYKEYIAPDESKRLAESYQKLAKIRTDVSKGVEGSREALIAQGDLTDDLIGKTRTLAKERMETAAAAEYEIDIYRTTALSFSKMIDEQLKDRSKGEGNAAFKFMSDKSLREKADAMKAYGANLDYVLTAGELDTLKLYNDSIDKVVTAIKTGQTKGLGLIERQRANAMISLRNDVDKIFRETKEFGAGLEQALSTGFTELEGTDKLDLIALAPQTARELIDAGAAYKKAEASLYRAVAADTYSEEYGLRDKYHAAAKQARDELKRLNQKAQDALPKDKIEDINKELTKLKLPELTVDQFNMLGDKSKTFADQLRSVSYNYGTLLKFKGSTEEMVKLWGRWKGEMAAVAGQLQALTGTYGALAAATGTNVENLALKPLLARKLKEVDDRVTLGKINLGMNPLEEISKEMTDSIERAGGQLAIDLNTRKVLVAEIEKLATEPFKNINQWHSDDYAKVGLSAPSQADIARAGKGGAARAQAFLDGAARVMEKYKDNLGDPMAQLELANIQEKMNKAFEYKPKDPVNVGDFMDKLGLGPDLADTVLDNMKVLKDLEAQLNKLEVLRKKAPTKGNIAAAREAEDALAKGKEKVTIDNEKYSKKLERLGLGGGLDSVMSQDAVKRVEDIAKYIKEYTELRDKLKPGDSAKVDYSDAIQTLQIESDKELAKARAIIEKKNITYANFISSEGMNEDLAQNLSASAQKQLKNIQDEVAASLIAQGPVDWDSEASVKAAIDFAQGLKDTKERMEAIITDALAGNPLALAKHKLDLIGEDFGGVIYKLDTETLKNVTDLAEAIRKIRNTLAKPTGLTPEQIAAMRAGLEQSERDLQDLKYDYAEMVRAAGDSFYSTVKSGIESQVTEFLMLKQSGMTTLKNVAQDFTQGLVKSFVEGMTEAMFETQATKSMFKDLGSKFFQWGSMILQGIGMFSGASAPAAGSGTVGPGIKFKLAEGGPIFGQGTETSDSIPAFLSNNEYVVRASRAKMFRPVLDAINFGKNTPKFAAGGSVSTGYGTSAMNSAVANRDKEMALMNSEKSLTQTFNIAVTGDISRQTRNEISRMPREIASMVNKQNVDWNKRQ